MAPDTSDRDRERDELEKRVRKVWHLDPFRINVREDGRFRCELDKPPEELTPEEARRVLEAMESLLDRLREWTRE